MYLSFMKAHSVMSLLGLIFALILNALAISQPLNGWTTQELSERYPNLFVPADLTFSIWSVIYLGLFAFVGYFLYTAFVKKAENEVLRATAPWFFVSCLANGLWIIAWHFLHVELSLVIMAVLLFSLIMIFLRIRKPASSEPFGYESWFVFLPFSIYLSWISVATVANTTAVLVHHGFTGLGLSEPAWTVIMMAVAGTVALTVTARFRDIPYLLTLAWAFGGIYIKRNPFLNPDERMITTSCIVWLSILALAVAYLIVAPALDRSPERI